jgi:mono/diheme cytochrome c family protein
MNRAHGVRSLLRLTLLGLFVTTPFVVAAFATTPATTPATGPSWLDKLGRNFDKSSLGRVGALGPREQDPELAAPAPKDGSWLRAGFETRGSDLFRFTCRSCHGAGGRGLAPEIKPLIDLVQATSPEWQKSQGAGGADRAQLAEKILRHQIAEGGRSMPGFDIFSAEESEALLGYLERLAAVADPRHVDQTLTIPVDRVGELIVKGTCQTCHEASTPAYRSATAASIPPLAGMTSSHSARAFVDGSRHRGKAGLQGKGPEVTYLRDPELEAAYFYLTAYPPR